MSEHKCLNVGCGPRLFTSPWVNADLLEDIGSDVVMDIEKSWPWEDNTFDQVWASHVAEHCFDKVHFIKEAWRVSKPGATVQIDVPLYSWSMFWDDPTHKSCWTERSLTWFQQGHPHHGAQPFKGGAEFVVEKFALRDGWELAWLLRVVKPGQPDCAHAPIEIQQPGGMSK